MKRPDPELIGVWGCWVLLAAFAVGAKVGDSTVAYDDVFKGVVIAMSLALVVGLLLRVGRGIGEARRPPTSGDSGETP